MSLGSGHWVLVETLSGTYATREEAREAKRREDERRLADHRAYWTMRRKLIQLGYTAPENN
jgi:hypothetical protein